MLILKKVFFISHTHSLPINPLTMSAPPEKKQKCPERKERRFCFAHVGSRMESSTFAALHFAEVAGTMAENGMQYTRVTLNRNNARQRSHLKNIITAYNKLASVSIVPVVVSPYHDSILAFSSTDKYSNTILARIHADATLKGCAYWEWPVDNGPEAKKRHTLSLVAMVRELGLDPKDVGMHGAEDELNRRYLEGPGKTPDARGMYDQADKDFLMGVLRVVFAVPLSFSVMPAQYDKKELPQHIRAGLDGWMGDCLPDGSSSEPRRAQYSLGREDGGDRQKIIVRHNGPVSEIVLAYLRANIAFWLECGHATVALKSRDIAFALNGDKLHGDYSAMTVCGLMNSLVADGVVEMFRIGKEVEYVVDVGKVGGVLGIVDGD